MQKDEDDVYLQTGIPRIKNLYLAILKKENQHYAKSSFLVNWTILSSEFGTN